MSTRSKPSPGLARLVARFCDDLLAADLPLLPEERRQATTDFVIRRVDGAPSPLRIGIRAAATAVDAAGKVAGRARVVTAARRWPVPIASDYVRLLRSLGYAYIWDRWPSTGPTGETR